MELELKITCTCHRAKIAICCQMPLFAPIAPKLFQHAESKSAIRFAL